MYLHKALNENNRKIMNNNKITLHMIGCFKRIHESVAK